MRTYIPNPTHPVLKICFGPPTAESKNLKNHVNFDVGDLFFRSPALWSSQNVFGPPTAGRVVVDFKDRGISHPQTSHSSNVIAAIPPPLCRCATMETLSTENARQRRWPALLLRQQRRHRLKTLVWTSFLLIWRTTHDERSIINTIIITIWSSRSSSFFVLFHMLLQADVFISRLLLLMSHHLTSQSKPNWWRFCCFSCSWF